MGPVKIDSSRPAGANQTSHTHMVPSDLARGGDAGAAHRPRIHHLVARSDRGPLAHRSRAKWTFWTDGRGDNVASYERAPELDRDLFRIQVACREPMKSRWLSRPVLVGACAVASVVAVVVAVSVISRSERSSASPTPTTPRPASAAPRSPSGLHVDDPFLFDVSIGALRNQAVVTTTQWTTGQQLQIAIGTTASAPSAIALMSFPPGQSHPVDLSTPETVDINGVPATMGIQSVGPGTQQYILNLPVAADHWVILQTQLETNRPEKVPLARQDLMTLAMATSPTPWPATVPFTLGWLPVLPDNVSILQVSNGPSYPAGGQVSIGSTTPNLVTSNSAPDDRVVIERGNLPAPDAPGVGLWPDAAALSGQVKDLTVDGRHVLIAVVPDVFGVSHRQLVVDLADGTAFRITVPERFAGTYDETTLLQILQRASFAPQLSDHVTWIPATDALP